MLTLKERMKQFYNHSEAYRDLLTSGERYRRDVELEHFVALVDQFGPASGRFLDLGCGTGETTQRLALKGHDVIGIDVSLLFLKARDLPLEERVARFAVADIASLPFQGHSVSCVCMNDVIEHIPEVDQLLEEIVRVLSNDGTVIIASPNLLSPVKPLRHIFRIEGFNTNFYGSHLRAFTAIFSNTVQNLLKLISPRPTFIFRAPLLDGFQCPDDDAVFLANFIDLQKWFRCRGFSVKYLQFKPAPDNLIGRMKSAILRWAPWLDKGFCLVARRS